MDDIPLTGSDHRSLKLTLRFDPCNFDRCAFVGDRSLLPPGGFVRGFQG